ncbi:pantothenate kinase [Ligilactobacillus sp. WC1T17]|uniref:Pantothenate kinase n=1 Tax=Ligilactobacillus ruminis TaxID=1623 RepID=A0ABY1ACL6_9LACO|nr:pantothenate kinase [Ligilactobacillus ruminis]
MENQINYYKIERDEWRNFYKDHIPDLTEEELERIKSLNDQISLKDVADIYLPMVHLLGMFMKHQQALQQDQAKFLGIKTHKVPFILGIAGSVAVGKSTTARLLKNLLAEVYPHKKVQLITTDGFIYPNALLKKKGIMARKGFPESYDMPRLIKFVNDVKNGIPAKAPVYSHKVYDIVADKFDIIDKPDILIVEGINVLQLPSHEPIYVSDFFDFSIYVDAKESYIKRWYLERFGLLLDTAFKDPTNYYYPYAIGDRKAAFKMAARVWQEVNHPNLLDYILPTKNRADLIVVKGKDHLIKELKLRKY